MNHSTYFAWTPWPHRCRVERSTLWEYTGYLAAIENCLLGSEVKSSDLQVFCLLSSIFCLQSSNFSPLAYPVVALKELRVRVGDKKPRPRTGKTGWPDHELNCPKDWLLNLKPTVTSMQASPHERHKSRPCGPLTPLRRHKHKMELLLDTHRARHWFTMQKGNKRQRASKTG